MLTLICHKFSLIEQNGDIKNIDTARNQPGHSDLRKVSDARWRHQVMVVLVQQLGDQGLAMGEHLPVAWRGQSIKFFICNQIKGLRCPAQQLAEKIEQAMGAANDHAIQPYVRQEYSVATLKTDEEDYEHTADQISGHYQHQWPTIECVEAASIVGRSLCHLEASQQRVQSSALARGDLQSMEQTYIDHQEVDRYPIR